MKGKDVALIPEPDGAQFIKPTDGARQAFKGWATSQAKDADLSRKAFREELNAGGYKHSHAHNKYGNRKRAYGDYLYYQDREKFEVDYTEWLAEQETKWRAKDVQFTIEQVLEVLGCTKAEWNLLSERQQKKLLETAYKELRRKAKAAKVASRSKAKDGLLSSPFMALAALLAILSHFNKEVVSPSDYDLTTYRPKRKIF